ncbi:MAG: hypothetical protein K6A41_09340 [Bacteroidales bacterium]|nr:hypothetical protein [Bacteroidales bacterium]
MSDKKIPIKAPSLAFLICLLLSVMAWLVVTFSQDYEVTQDYKLVSYNIPEGKKTATFSDTVISLTFNQKGVNYLMKPYSNKDKVVYVSITDLVKTKKKVSVYTFTNKEMRDFLSQYNFGPELVSVEAPEVLTIYVK